MRRSRLLLEVCEDRILCSAAPNVSLSGAQTVVLPKSGAPVANFTATFNNAGTTAGFGPYIDLALNTKGIDGAVSPPADGLVPAPINNNARIYWDTLPAQDPNKVLSPGAPGDSQDRDYGATPGYVEAAANPTPDDPGQDTVGLTLVQDAIQGTVYRDADVSGTFTPGDFAIP
jgi:hypothetical protein